MRLSVKISSWGNNSIPLRLSLDGSPCEREHDDAIKWKPLQWRNNERDVILNHQPHECFLNCLFSSRSKKTSKLRVTGLWTRNSPVTGEFPAQRASNGENVSIWGHHGDFPRYWIFVRRIHLSPMKSPHRGQWHRVLIWSLICAWTNGRVNNQYACDLRRNSAQYDVTVLSNKLWAKRQHIVYTNKSGR